MRKFTLKCLSTIFFLTYAAYSYGQMPASKPAGQGQIQEMKKLELPQKKPTAPLALPPVVKPVPLVPQRATYLHPGIIAFLNGQWEGSDHLLNISPNIGAYVTLIKPENEKLGVTQEQLQNAVEVIFNQVGIKPLTLVASGQPPLPAFEIEIFIYPVDKGYAASCNGRLFESVFLERFKLDSNMAFQAITWEKQFLIVGPVTTFNDQLVKVVQDITRAFTERFQTYERLKNSK